MHEHEESFYHQSFKAPIVWLRAISDGAHRIHLDWNQIGWKHPDRSDRVSRETINQLTACFARRMKAFALPLRPAGVNAALKQWLDSVATNPIPIIYPCHRAVHGHSTIEHYGGGSQLTLNHRDSMARRAFLIAHEKTTSMAVNTF